MNNKESLINYTGCGKFIFLEFTKELIRNYSPEKILKIKNEMKERLELENELKKTKNEIKEHTPIFSVVKPQVIIQKEPPVKQEWFNPIKEEQKSPVLKKEAKFPDMQKYRKPIEIKREENVFRELKLVMPETKFPLHIQYIKPVPMNKEIDLGKLNPLVNDKFVKVIECYGSNENIMVKGAMGTKKTAVVLTDDEIKSIVNKFSEETKIPAQEGIFKVAAGRLLFSAIISDIVGSKFIISKITPPEQPETYRNPRQMRY